MASEITPGQRVFVVGQCDQGADEFGYLQVVFEDGLGIATTNPPSACVLPLDDLREVLRRISHVAEALHDLEQTSSPYDGERTLSATGTPFLVVESEYVETIKAELGGAIAIGRDLRSRLGEAE